MDDDMSVTAAMREKHSLRENVLIALVRMDQGYSYDPCSYTKLLRAATSMNATIFNVAILHMVECIGRGCCRTKTCRN